MHICGWMVTGSVHKAMLLLQDNDLDVDWAIYQYTDELKASHEAESKQPRMMVIRRVNSPG